MSMRRGGIYSGAANLLLLAVAAVEIRSLVNTFSWCGFVRGLPMRPARQSAPNRKQPVEHGELLVRHTITNPTQRTGSAAPSAMRPLRSKTFLRQTVPV